MFKKIIDYFFYNFTKWIASIVLGFFAAYHFKDKLDLGFKYGIGLWLILIIVMYFAISFFLFTAKKIVFFLNTKFDIPLLNRINVTNLTLKELEFIKKLEASGLIEIPLENLSYIWKDKKDIEINIKQLSKNWRAQKIIEMEEKYKQIKHDKIIDFHDFVKKLLTALYRDDENDDMYFLEFNIIQMLLIKLDMQGECPSVINPKQQNNFRGNEPDAYKTKESALNRDSNGVPKPFNEQDKNDISSWKLVSGVSLMDHTIRVANNIIKLVQENEKLVSMEKVYLPDAVIVALAHDLGKIPAEYEKTLEPHYLISAEILDRIIKNSSIDTSDDTDKNNQEEELIVPKKKESKPIKMIKIKANTLIKVVKDHHKRTVSVSDEQKDEINLEYYENLFDLLKKADSQSRREEENEQLSGMGIYEKENKEENKKEDNKNPLDNKDPNKIIKDIADLSNPKNSTPNQDNQEKSVPITSDLDFPPVSEQNTNPDINQTESTENIKTPIIIQPKSDLTSSENEDSIPPPNLFMPDFEEFCFKKGIKSDNKDNNKQDNSDEDREPDEDYAYKKQYLKCDWIDNEIENENIINLIESRINYVRQIKGNNVYSIFSIKDTVFVTPYTIINMMLFFADKNNDLNLVTQITMNKSIRRAVAVLLVDKLKKIGAIDVSNIKPDYFSGKFILYKQEKFNSDKYTEIKGSYTPMKLIYFANAYQNGKIHFYDLRKKSKLWDKDGILKKFTNFKWNSE